VVAQVDRLADGLEGDAAVGEAGDWQRRSTRRSGTTTWRGSMEPAAASGRNGW
jgi:hypothetical protein